MANFKTTARKRVHVRATPEEVIRAYQRYRPCYGDNLGEFLSHYHRHWSEAHAHGVTGYDGIIRLIELLPPSWQCWARDMIRDFTFQAEPHHDLVGDLPRFVGTLQYRFSVFEQAPTGPYVRPGDLEVVGPSAVPVAPAPQPPPPMVPAPVLEQVSPPHAVTLSRQGRDNFEEGPSDLERRPPTPFRYPADPPPPDEEGSTRNSAEYRHMRQIRGKALIIAEPEVEGLPEPEPEPLAQAPCSRETRMALIRATITRLADRMDEFVRESQFSDSSRESSPDPEAALRRMDEFDDLQAEFRHRMAELEHVDEHVDEPVEEPEEDPEEEPDEDPEEDPEEDPVMDIEGAESEEENPMEDPNEEDQNDHGMLEESEAESGLSSE